MGVPKFYRWVSERYPCLSQVVQEHQIPEFDNLYLDMNGIIHPCSHPNDDDPHFRITEEQIFRNIFHYIEVLFQIIKPKKVFFMAVDGVAPRAKMNQQRGRRFRSAREAEDNIRRALEKGQILPKEERFDSNCITPGTVFMTRLHEQLKYFVAEKISNDPAWHGLKVYLSGHQTPGEGEHKIMEFIRTERCKPGYDPNTKHCLYGLDADLIMLGLSSHEPHFSLLREEVRFGKTSKRIEKPENITFHLLHLSLFREYLDWEFHSLKNSLTFPYDVERIIDDWILMGFLVGNDFIPHLPHLHINHNALPLLYKVYMEVMPTLDGYLHEGGTLSLSRFEKYLLALSKLDWEKFEEVFVDMKWFEAKSKHGFDKKPGKSKSKVEKDAGFSTDNCFAALDALSDQMDKTNLETEEEKLSPELAKLAAAMDEQEDEENDDVFEIEFAMHKKQYYREKFEIEDINSGGLSRIVWEYIRGIQWILHYYFNGVQSWGWYYPYHYAPFLSDLKFFSEQELNYEMGKPFLPFEQLLAVLPAASKQLLPLPLQNLMIMEESPIIDFYPLDFKTDLNGKQQEWEAVVLIPFIDEKMLLDAIKPLYPRLAKEERQRNTHGPFHVYTYDNDLSYTYPSSFPVVFPDILLCHAKCEDFDREVLVAAPKDLIKGMCEGVRLDVYFPGFPTLHHIEHTAELKKANVKVFQMHSRWESMILQLKPHPDKVTIRVAEDLLGEVCYVGWPHMVEAKVISVSDNTFRYTLSHDKPKSEDEQKNIEQNVMTNQGLAIWNKQVSCYTQYQLERRGIEVGDVSILVEACPIQGRRFICSAKGQVTLEKEWSQVPKHYALQSVAKDIFIHESVTKNNIQTIEQLFPIGSQCFMLAAPHYGAQGEVLEVDVSQGRVRVQLKVPTEPNIAPVVMKRKFFSVTYTPAHVLAQKLGISNSLLGKITAKFLIERGSREKSKGQGQAKLDIGLNLKHSKHNKELIGYTKRTDHGIWSFSPAAHKIIADYILKFPRLFEVIGSLESQCDQLYESDLLKKDISEETLQEVQTWLKSLPLAKQQVLPCGGDILDDPVLEEIEKIVQETKKTSQTKLVKVRVRPYLLFRPSDYLGNILPDSDAEFQLFDRVINVKLNSAVPFGLRGTIVGFHTGEDGDEMVEVLYDESFVGHQPVRRTFNSVYMVRPSSFIDLTYGERKEAKKRGQPVPPPRPLNKTFSSALAGGNSSPQRNGRNGGSPRTNRHAQQGISNTKDILASPLVSIQNLTKTSSQENGKPVVTVTRIATPPNRQVTTTAGNTDNKKGRNTEREIPPRFQKGKKDKVQAPVSSGNSSEFANMWKELQMKENSPPAKEESETEPQADQAKPSRVTTVSSLEAEMTSSEQSNVPSVNEKHLKGDTRSKSPHSFAQESTQALCQLLHIGHHSPTSSSQTSPKEPSETRKERTAGETLQEVTRTPGTPLSVEELFKSQGTPSLAKPPQPNMQVPAPSLNQSRIPSQDLLRYCLSTGLPQPIFHYSKGPTGMCAVVELANGLKFTGALCRDRAEAAESASAVALSQLNRVNPAFQLSGGSMMGLPLGRVLYPGMPIPQNILDIQQRMTRPPMPQQRLLFNPEFGFQRPAQMGHLVYPAGPGMTRAGQGMISADSRMTNLPHGPAPGVGVTHDVSNMVFVPMQVTRRNVSSKADTRSQPSISDAEQGNQIPDVPPNVVPTELSHNNAPAEPVPAPQGVLIPPSSFSDSANAKCNTTDLPLQDGTSGSTKGRTSPLSLNAPVSPNIKKQLSNEETGKTSIDTKQDRPLQKSRSSAARKGQKSKLLAPSFFNN